MKYITLILYFAFNAISITTYGQEFSVDNDNIQRIIRAVPITSESILIDGRLEENIWKKNLANSSFVQRDPHEGDPSVSETEIAIVYDEKAIYIAARMKSLKPIFAPVARRDTEGNAERIVISLDTYNDGITAYSFGVTASGVRLDYYHPRDNQFPKDFSFDPVWHAKIQRTNEGWQAEMKIPFSQLRFENDGDLEWGININRWIPTENEDSYFVLIPKNETGWASRFGRLVGIEQISRSRNIEIIPYVASNGVLLPANPTSQNPFYERFSVEPRIGGDIKTGLGSNLTLEATINPDFGQVEADPAQVNLGVFETFLQEKRPFFTEGRQLFRGPSGPNYFYSRRIGSRPSGQVNGDYVDRPDFTNILGATKLTGRTSKGLSIGFLTALTQREYAKVYDKDSAVISNIPIQPQAGIGILRVQQQLASSNSTVGIRFTGLNRQMDHNSLLSKQFTREAYTGSADWNLRFIQGKYSLSGSLGFSTVQGSKSVIYRLQKAGARYFQRPDASHLTLDENRTSLNGYAANLQFAKNSGQHWLWMVSSSIFSPGFEINDVGLMYSVDRINYFGSLRYRENSPRNKLLRGYLVGLGMGRGYNFAGTKINNSLNLFSNLRFKNFWSLNGNIYTNLTSYNPRLTRGGPLMKNPLFWGTFLNISSNPARNTIFQLQVDGDLNELGQHSFNVRPQISFQPAPMWKMVVEPRYGQATIYPQYVSSIDGGPVSTYGKRYIFAFIDRTTISVQFRVNYSFTPALSLEFYGEPFVASGHYYKFGELEKSRTYNIFEYGSDDSSISSNNGSYSVTKDGTTFIIPNLDFNRESLRSNLVLRWQWNPGSTLFLVWSQNMSDFTNIGHAVGPNNLLDTFSNKGTNFVGLKATYWIPVGS